MKATIHAINCEAGCGSSLLDCIDSVERNRPWLPLRGRQPNGLAMVRSLAGFYPTLRAHGAGDATWRSLPDSPFRGKGLGCLRRPGRRDPGRNRIGRCWESQLMPWNLGWREVADFAGFFGNSWRFRARLCEIDYDR